MRSIRNATISFLLMAFGLCVSPSVSFGQGSTWAGEGLARMLESAMWRAGRLRANVALQLRDVGYDSDIYYGYFGGSVPDGTFSASTPVQLLFSLNKNTVLELFDAPRYDFYLKTTAERAWNNTFRGQFHFALSKIYLRVGGELANNRRRLSQELDVNIREKTDRVDALALWQASRITSLALFYDQVTYDYGDILYGGASLAETLNRRVDSLEFATFVQSNPRFRFFLDGQFANYDFTSVISRIKNTRSYALFGGFVSVLQEESPNQVGRIDGYARIGYEKFDVLNVGQPDGSGLVGDVDLTVGIFKLTNARLFYSKGYEFSIFAEATFFAEQSYGVGLVRQLSRRAALSYELTIGQSSYPRTAGGSYSGLLYRFTNHRLNLSLALARNLRVSLSGTLARRVTSETSQVWRRWIVGLSLDYGALVGPESALFGGLIRATPGFTD